MKQGTFELEIFIDCDVDSVITLLSDFKQHHRIHPLIEKVERADNEPVGIRRYLITDKLRWGPFTFRIKYQADILSVTKNKIHSQAVQSPGITLNNLTSVFTETQGVRLHEKVTVKAPALLFGFTLKQAKQAHREMFKRIKTYLQSTASA
jgi:hypothetical protein